MTELAALSHDDFYAQFTERNRGLISEHHQNLLRRTRFVVAGCGSTGGACVMPLVRSGAERLVLLDPGDYELNNLNRQEATVAEVGNNKARATADRVRAVNPFIEVEVFEDGVDPDSIPARLSGGDVVIDAVDVTTDAGVRAKYALHQAACALRLKVLTAYDIGATQFIEMYDYENIREPLAGRVSELTSERVLRALIPPVVLPREIFAELLARRTDPERGFPQLMMTSTQLGALVVPYVLRLLDGESVKRRVRVDVNDLVRPLPVRMRETIRRYFGLARLWWRLRG
jgi:hypothetical protein